MNPVDQEYYYKHNTSGRMFKIYLPANENSLPSLQSEAPDVLQHWTLGDRDHIELTSQKA